MSGSDSDDDFAISGGAAAAPAPAAAADDDEVAAADEPADEPEPETTAASVLGAAFSLFAPKPTAPPAQEAKRESITAASISITEPEPASTAEPADSAPELPAKVTEEDLTELIGRAAAAEPTARVLNALLAKVDAMGTKIEALEAENRSLKAGLVPLIKSVAAAPQDASEGVPGEVPEAAGMRPRFVAAAGLSPAEEIAGRRLFDEADQMLRREKLSLPHTVTDAGCLAVELAAHAVAEAVQSGNATEGAAAQQALKEIKDKVRAPLAAMRRAFEAVAVDSGTQPDGEALSAAAKAGKLDEVVALVEGGAPIEWANVGGLTALHAASDGGHRDVVALLLSHSAEVNAHTNFHKTPLLLAATMGHSAVCSVLLEGGADPSVAGERGDTALDEAKRGKNNDWEACVALLAPVTPAAQGEGI